MKRFGAILCTLMLILTIGAPAVFAENDAKSVDAANATNAANGDLTIEYTSPGDGTKDVAVDNFSVQIRFNKDVKPSNKTIRKSNEKQFALKDDKGKKIPLLVFYSEEEEGLLLVAANIKTSKNRELIKGDTAYTLTISRDFTATDGTKLGQMKSVTLKTLNQKRSMGVYMVLMIAMMVGMIFFTIRSTKKAQEKEKEKEVRKTGVNPYKQAKKSGKSVEEIVEKDNKRKAKAAEAEAKKQEALKQLEAEIREQMRKENNKRVSGPRPISAAGSTYKVKVKKAEAKKPAPQKTSKGTTNPKKGSGKKKNSKKK